MSYPGSYLPAMGSDGGSGAALRWSPTCFPTLLNLGLTEIIILQRPRMVSSAPHCRVEPRAPITSPPDRQH